MVPGGAEECGSPACPAIQSRGGPGRDRSSVNRRVERMMLVYAPDQLAQSLHECNSRLGFWLDSLLPADLPGNGRPTLETHAASPEQMAGLLSELMRAGAGLRSLPTDQSRELENELSAYRKNVERLRELMPSIHATLLQERARLEKERGRLESAAQWARSSRQTL